MSESEIQSTMPGPLRPGQIVDPIVVVQDLRKTYGKGDSAVQALRGVSLEIGRANFTAIMGPSGSGKSTLLHCLAGLDQASSGSIILDGKDITRMKERQRAKLRRDHIGFVFQSFNLIPTLTAEENITLPADIARRRLDPSHLNAVVQAVGLSDRLKHRPGELSGGEQQRVACARALAAQPTIIVADEPTGNLDSRATRQVLQVLRQAVDQFQQTVIMVTHDASAAAHADRVIFLVDGEPVGEIPNPDVQSVRAALNALDEEADSTPINWIPTVSDEDLTATSETEPISAIEAAPPAAETVAEEPPSEESVAVLAPEEPTEEPIAEPDESAEDSGARALEEELNRIAPAPHLPEETVKVIDRAQQILSDLPGSVVDDYTPDPEP